ncbi:hypothetical protein B0H11DRAFT_2262569 [Mycena galericulata]|nr:hypothetical protein B0H11DRAFT_2262569 [Mycena galericulata]
MASPDANPLANFLLAPDFHRIVPYCSGFNGTGITDGEGVERPRYDACFQHGELAPRFDWAHQYPLHILEDGSLHILDDGSLHVDEDDDEMPELMSQDESDSFKTNRVRGFKPRNLSKL